MCIRDSSNANAEGHGINVHHPLSNFKTGKLVFMHQRLMYSKGYQFKCFDTLLKNIYYYILLTVRVIQQNFVE